MSIKGSFKSLFTISLAMVFIASSCNNGTKDSTATASTSASGADTASVKIAEDAFVFGLPLVLIDITRRKLTNVEAVTADGAPVNQLLNKHAFPDYTFRDVVRPNADTYYSIAFLDMSKDAMVLSLPAFNGRYYMMPMLDAYSNIFASPGSRTTGDKAGDYLVTGPKWTGTVPAGIKEIKAPTDIVWIIGRIQTNSKADGEKVVIPLQNKIKLVPLGAWGKAYNAPKGSVDSTVPKGGPNEIVTNMPIDEFFNYVNQLMVSNPPNAADKSAMDLFAKIGIGPGAKFDIGKFDTATQAAMQKIPKGVYAAFSEELARPKQLVNGWNIMMKGMGTYGTDYGMRALIADFGLGANLPEDAIYPSNNLDADGKPYNGANKYTIHFEKGQTPPVNGFWSLTMYDQEGYFIQNPINTYAIGHGAPFTYNADGSLDIYIQNASPGKDKENNWLPAPAGDFNMIMRLYWPKEAILNSTWTPPAIKKAS